MDLGFRRPSPADWQEPDPMMSFFASLQSDGSIGSISGERLVEQLQAPQISAAAPEALVRLFETARGAMCYGYFFYPLFTLGAQQLFRVVEAGVMTKCKALGAAKGVNRFERGIAFLAEQGVLTAEETGRLNILRRLRNEASHAKDQEILTPAMALDVVALTAETVNTLFPA